LEQFTHRPAVVGNVCQRDAIQQQLVDQRLGFGGNTAVLRIVDKLAPAILTNSFGLGASNGKWRS